MPVRHQNHRGIPMPPAVLPGDNYQPLNLALRQVLYETALAIFIAAFLIHLCR
jgi:hypothetical protein